MTDFFSERYSALYIRGAALLAVVAGIGEILLAVNAPELVSKWAIWEGIIVIALAYGVWKRSLASAIALLGLKTVGAIVWSLQSGRVPNATAVTQLIFCGLAVGAILLGRSNPQRHTSSAQPSASSGETK